MNFITLSGVYESSRRILRLVHHTHLAQQLKVIADDPKKVGELSLALEALDSHIRVMGMEEVIK
jgi:hypothetical protein